MPYDRSITLTPSQHGLPHGWTAAAFRDELVQAAASFSPPALACSSVHLTVAPTAARRITTEDGTSLVVFRSEQWCHNEICGHLDTFPTRAMAMTETRSTGAHRTAINEADIELNALHFRYAADGEQANPEERFVPLRAVLVHEIGHVLGLEDRCVSDGQHGVHAAVPEFGRCRAGEAESVMFAPALNLTPSALDIAALCGVHPGSTRPPRSTSSEATLVGPAVPMLEIAALLMLAVMLARIGLWASCKQKRC